MTQNIGKPSCLRGIDVLLAAIAVLITANAAEADLYTVSDLGILTDLPGRTEATVGGINHSGKLVASSMVHEAYAAMIYGGVWTNLGTLGGADSFGADVNDSVRVVGSSTSAGGPMLAFLWTPGGTDGVPGNPQMKELGTLGGPSSRAYAINSSGQATGYAETSQNDYSAFRYSGGALSDIGALLGNNLPNSCGYGINDAGHVAGEARDSQWAWNSLSAFFYDGTNAAIIRPLAGGKYASALALNNADQVVGFSDTAAGFEHAFRYAGGVISDLGALGGNNSYANAINNSNVVVGVAGIDPGDDTLNHAFVYVGGSMTDLNMLLDASGSGWTLVEATDLNDAGQIVGFGTYGGVNHGFLLKPSLQNPSLQITQQPTNLAAACQSNASFTVAAAPLPLSCQWYKGSPPDRLAIASATNFTLILSNVTGLQSGDYYAVVANTLVSATSSVATLTIFDSTPPVLSGCPGNLTNYTAPNLCSAVVTWPVPTALDACDGAVPVFSAPTNGATFSKGVTTVTCWASDSSHNTNTCSFTVTVLDNQPPFLSGCPGNLTNYTAPNLCSAAVTWPAPTAFDNCDGAVPVFSAPTNGVTFSKGVTTVTCWASDSSRNTNTCTFTVTVLDNQAPFLSGCPGNLTNYTAPNLCSAAVTWPAPTALDACDGAVPVFSVPANGATFSKGVTTVTCWASDSSHNTNTCTFTVTVLDNQAPVLSGCPGNLTNYTAPNLCSAVVTWPAPTALDACDGAVPEFSSPTNGATFSKGVTTVTCWASDSSHNTNTCTFTVTLLDNQAPVLSGCPGNLTNYTAPNLCSAVVTWPAPTALDACDGVVPVFSAPANGATFSKGVTTVTCWASDSSHNTNTCTFTVTVLDNQAPVLSGCPGNLTNYTAPNLCSAVVTWPPPTALDACDGVVPVFSTHGAFFTKGVTTITCWASDSSHNTNACTFTVTVLDNQPLVLSGCPPNLTNYIALGASNAVVTWSNPTATDNCDGVVPVFATPTNGSTFNLGVTPVTCWATDSSENTNTCTFSVAVFQVEPPVITGIQVEGTNVLLSFTTQDAVHYAIDSRQILTTGSWNTVMTGITGTGGTVTVTNFGAATVPARFYRVRVTLPVFQVEPPVITGIQVEGTNVLLGFTTQEAAHYAVDSRQILTTGSWDTVMTGITGTGGVVTVTNSGTATVAARFYRVRLTLPQGM
jgi:probable HAF family extracellular repeat protein